MMKMGKENQNPLRMRGDLDSEYCVVSHNT